MKFIAVQTGARRGYAVPLILEKAGMLERFYTDASGNAGWVQLLQKSLGFAFKGNSIHRLLSRKIPSEILHKSSTFDLHVLVSMARNSIGSKDPAIRFERSLQLDQSWGRQMIRRGYGNATHVFSMLGEGGPFLTEASRRGLTTVGEVYILLATEKIMEIERSEFPDWEPNSPKLSELRRKLVKTDALIESTDFHICPSEAVQYDLVHNWGVNEKQTRLVPYGMHPRWLDLEPQPEVGRILFVGTAELRKGIHYLAMASEILFQRGHRFEFRVAGNVTQEIRNHPVCKHLTFLGRVPRDKIHEEFQKADVFVLPSLAEGSAEVTYEALAAGVPIVVTPATGSVARDGVEGRIVGERDPSAIATAIESIVEDRELRSRMAIAARQRARDFTWEKYGERLLNALRESKK